MAVGEVATVLAVGLAVPVSVLAAECVAGLVPSRTRPPRSGGPRPTAAVIVPAHDEEALLGGTLEHLCSQLGPHDRVVVVADNCSDRTADVARAHGVEVLERFDAGRRGKGFAISFALEALAASPPDVVVIFDADCRASKGALERISALAADSGRPVQAEYLLAPPRDPSLRTRVSAFAIIVRNRVRARGLSRLAGTCQLVGSGMAFPWDVIRNASALGDHLVEDLALGFDCALRGHAPLLCVGAEVQSELPVDEGAALTQRRRWETGHLSMLGRAWSLALAGIARRDRALLGMGLDLSVPPLALLGFGLTLGTASAAAALLTGAALPAAGLALETGTAALAIGLAWVAFGREVLPPRAVLAIPAYMAWKLPLYLKFARAGKERQWVRTERKAS